MIEVLNTQQQEKTTTVKIRSGMKEFYKMQDKKFTNNPALKETLKMGSKYYNVSLYSILARNTAEVTDTVTKENSTLENLLRGSIATQIYNDFFVLDKEEQKSMMNIKTNYTLFYDDNNNYCIVDTKLLKTHMRIIKDKELQFKISDKKYTYGESNAIQVCNNDNEYFILLTCRNSQARKNGSEGLVLDDFKNDNTTIIHVK